MPDRLTTIARLQDGNRCLIGVSALLGTVMGCVALSDPGLHMEMLSAASMAILTAVCLLTAGVAIDALILARARTRVRSSEQHRDVVAPSGLDETSIDARQQVLDQRLDIDEPRLCTQAKKPCTMWSLCGSEAATGAGAAQPIVLLRRSEMPQAKDGALPAIMRSNVLGCPYEDRGNAR